MIKLSAWTELCITRIFNIFFPLPANSLPNSEEILGVHAFLNYLQAPYIVSPETLLVFRLVYICFIGICSSIGCIVTKDLCCIMKILHLRPLISNRGCCIPSTCIDDMPKRVVPGRCDGRLAKVERRWRIIDKNLYKLYVGLRPRCNLSLPNSLR